MISKYFYIFFVLGIFFSKSEVTAKEFVGVFYVDKDSGAGLLRGVQTPHGFRWSYLEGMKADNASSLQQAALDQFQEQTGFLRTPTGTLGQKSFPFLTLTQVQNAYRASALDLEGNSHTMFIVIGNTTPLPTIPQIVNNVNLLLRQGAASVDLNNVPSSWSYTLYPFVLPIPDFPRNIIHDGSLRILESAFVNLLSQKGVKDYLNRVAVPLPPTENSPIVSSAAVSSLPPTQTASAPSLASQPTLAARRGFGRSFSSSSKRNLFASSRATQTSNPLFPTTRTRFGYRPSMKGGRENRSPQMFTSGRRFGRFSSLLGKGRLSSSQRQFSPLSGRRLFQKRLLSSRS